VNKGRFISKMFLLGNSVIIVLRNPKWVSCTRGESICQYIANLLLSSMYAKCSKHGSVRCDISWTRIRYVCRWRGGFKSGSELDVSLKYWQTPLHESSVPICESSC
jgi:hypothetical protein